MNDTQVSTWEVLCSSCIYQTVQKEKDPVFTGVSSQHINTTINLQSIFILCFHLIFNCSLIISVELSSRHSLFVVIMVQERKSWDGLKVMLLRPREITGKLDVAVERLSVYIVLTCLEYTTHKCLDLNRSRERGDCYTRCFLT